MPITSFLDLDVYQRSYKAALKVNKDVLPLLPVSEKYDLKDQASRASKAIPALIAEGYAKKHHRKSWQKYIDDAIGEANEMIVHLSLAKDLYDKFIDQEISTDLINEYNIIGKQLYRLGQSWNSPLQPISSLPDPLPTSSSKIHLLLASPATLALTLPGMNGTPLAIPAGVPVGGLSRANDIFGTGVQTAFVIAIVIALFLIVWSGIQWMTSSGEKEKIAAARKRITYTIIGLLVMVLSVFFVNIILMFFHLQYFGQSNIARSRQLQIEACEAKGKVGQIGHRGDVTCVDKPASQDTGCGKTRQKPCKPTSSDKDGCSSPLDTVIRGKCMQPGG